MTYPKYCIIKKTKEKTKVADIDFDKNIVTIVGYEDRVYFVSFKDVEFDYSDIDLDDMYDFLRHMYTPKEVLEKMCEARGI